jgi:hypothetical protein
MSHAKLQGVSASVIVKVSQPADLDLMSEMACFAESSLIESAFEA